ncbi:MAG: sodium:proton antiporter NhaD [Gammaproteobacteria bacterium]|jgi:Na+/H+ antiporter NhaD/arsenite permease-like protein|nr:sodium:proton antiporter NhaD [Gammaproteobacteria bacterium]MBT3860521.1 sodium:proton antiporter NhaD [Gammaproteobacteria bacterium]MBT3987353.1 sodium:proton antiporter NhaD [Gammaproteobacteria bacterium]MBT4256962.1 sodium:proton antiporter NhaD [Gammaproteobacteria bacterium]MBT4581909.1 sodium:proton antiporter NhaD [Gammaproteobacteria bacterium]
MVANLNSAFFSFIKSPITILALLTLFPVLAFAASADPLSTFNLTDSWLGYFAIAIFVAAYALIILEENIHLKKSKPAVVAAGVIWILVAIAYIQQGDTHTAEELVRHNLLEFVELFLFLLAAMTYINTMEERGVFNLLRVKLVSQGFTLKQIFWITGLLAFFMSPIADNLTTALLMAAVVMAVGGDNTKFISVACINVVVAANAGGAFSPFGDITTLMVWQAGIVQFQEFFVLFIPSLVNWLVTATILSFAIAKGKPDEQHEEATVKFGAWIVVGLFIMTVAMAVSFHNFLHLPPVLGMMTGLGMLKLFGYYLQRRDSDYMNSGTVDNLVSGDAQMFEDSMLPDDISKDGKPYDIYKNLQRAEWDTLIFFYGIILCVGGLGAFGYLAMVSEFMYGDLGATTANIIVGFASALVDNIPVMFAVLEMSPEMNHGQWLLVTLTAGVGGSMLSIGSAAGVAVMGQARGVYTFFSHLKWSWAIMLGYFASIGAHFLINGAAFA